MPSTMSFGLRTNHTVAVQSGWDRNRKVIFGFPIPWFMALVEEGLREYVEGMGEQ